MSIGILVLMLLLAGQVMSLTVKSTGQAKALTEVNQQLRVFEATLREDLSGVRLGESLMVIVGNPVNAYWTEEGKEADGNGDPWDDLATAPDPNREDPLRPGRLEPPRADMLMVITANRQVVYGHADVGEYARGGGFALDPTRTYPDRGDYETPFGCPAERWHLARRAVSLWNPPRDSVPPPNPPAKLDDVRILQGEVEEIEYSSQAGAIIPGFNYGDLVETAGVLRPWYLPGIFEGGSVPFARSQLDLTPPPWVSYGVSHFLLQNCASFKVEWALDPNSDFVGGRLEGEHEVFWFDPGARPPDPPPADAEPYALRSLYEAARQAAGSPRGERLDALLTDRLGGGAADYSLQDRFGGMDPPWVNDSWLYPDGNDEQRPYVAVFAVNRREPPSLAGPGDVIPEDIFPGALRITIDVFDRERRLDRPVRHVIMVRVGQEQ